MGTGGVAAWHCVPQIFFLDIDQPRDALKKIKKKLLHNDKSTPGIARTESDPLAGVPLETQGGGGQKCRKKRPPLFLDRKS